MLLSANKIYAKFNSILSSSNNLLKETFTKSINRFYSNEKSSGNDEQTSGGGSTSKTNITLTEDLPPIPPNYGWPGDDNIKSIFEMKRIRDSFKYGNPPRMKRRLVKGPPVIRLMPITHCSNRRFFRMVVTRNYTDLSDPYIEDLGSIDPMPNKDNQILVALNIERIKYYLSRSTPVKQSAATILGLSGLLPVHPDSYYTAFINRRKLKEQNEANKKIEEEAAAASAQSDQQAKTQAQS